MTPPLGRSASFLLGMLLGSPRSADELHVLIGRLVEDESELLRVTDEVDPGLEMALVALYDAGADEVRRLLERLVEFSLADRVALDGSVLYAHRMLRR